MRNGICPKCNSSEVFKRRDGIGFGDGGGGVMIYTSWPTAVTETDCYICVGCGFMEIYSLNKPKLQEVSQKWEKVK